MANNNIYTITGVVYEKPVRVVTSKKDGKEYEFKSIILEVKRVYKDRSFSELPEFQLGRGVDDEPFAIGDNVEITFSLSGKRVNKDWHKSEIKALYIKHTDRDYNDTKEVGFDPASVRKKEEEVFTPPNPYETDEESDLPF